MSLGGLGICQASDHAAVAFLSSVSSSAQLIQQISGKPSQLNIESPLLQFNAKPALTLTEESYATYSQKQLSFSMDSSNREELLSLPHSQRDKVRLLSVTLPKSGSWVNSLPSKALCLHLSNKKFLVTAKYKQGQPVFSCHGICPSCRAPSDMFGDHAIVCTHDGERISRHNMLRDALYRAAS